MMVCVGSTPEKILGLPLEALPFFLGSLWEGQVRGWTGRAGMSQCRSSPLHTLLRYRAFKVVTKEGTLRMGATLHLPGCVMILRPFPPFILLNV